MCHRWHWRSHNRTRTLVLGVFPFTSRTQQPTAIPAHELMAQAHVTLEATLKANAANLLTASVALDAAAHALLQAGKGTAANRAKQAAITARQQAQEWV